MSKFYELKEVIQKALDEGFVKCTISDPGDKAALYKKIVIENKQSAGFFQAARYTSTQVFHLNFPPKDALGNILSLSSGYGQISLQTKAFRYSVKICGDRCKVSKENIPFEVKSSSHDRQKNYLLPEGVFIPPLKDMGIMSEEGKILSSGQDKFRQINRFLECVKDVLPNKKSLKIIDFGCGKSYLTFLVYHYLTAVLGLDVEAVGLDLKKDVISKCNEAAKKYGYFGLKFEVGDINGYNAPFKPDIVMTLHACDTATDYALYSAVKWGAGVILSVPCCQHELSVQMKKEGILSRYGIIKDRFCALATDAIRANTLSALGYKTQLLEFIDLSHTPKNILIRAVKRPYTPEKAKDEAVEEMQKLILEFGFSPKIVELFNEDLGI